VKILKWLADRGPDVLLWAVWGCVIFNGFNAIAEYTDAHGLFPKPWGGYAMAITVDGLLVYAFMTFGRDWRLGALLLASAAGTTYMLQRWHAEMIGATQSSFSGQHTLIVAGIVPGAMVLVTFAWHVIKSRRVHEPVTERAVQFPERTQERTERDQITDRSLAASRPTKARPASGQSPKPNGSGSPLQRAIVTIQTQPGLSTAGVAAAAGVSERTVGNARRWLREKEGTP
jgi:hypothetical protein